MDGSVGFEVTENPTLILPSAFIFFFPFLPSNICVLGYSSLNEVSGPLVSLKRKSQAPFY